MDSWLREIEEIATATDAATSSLGLATDVQGLQADASEFQVRGRVPQRCTIDEGAGLVRVVALDFLHKQASNEFGAGNGVGEHRGGGQSVSLRLRELHTNLADTTRHCSKVS